MGEISEGTKIPLSLALKVAGGLIIITAGWYSMFYTVVETKKTVEVMKLEQEVIKTDMATIKGQLSQILRNGLTMKR